MTKFCSEIKQKSTFMIKWKPKQTSKHKKISEIKKKTNPNFISHSSPSYVFKENKGAWMRLVISYLRKTRAASRTTSSSAMYINGDIRSRTKKHLENIIYIKGREIWDLIKPILPWLGFVQIDSNFIRDNLDKLALRFVHTIFS